MRKSSRYFTEDNLREGGEASMYYSPLEHNNQTIKRSVCNTKPFILEQLAVIEVMLLLTWLNFHPNIQWALWCNLLLLLLILLYNLN